MLVSKGFSFRYKIFEQHFVRVMSNVIDAELSNTGSYHV
jgi:hypothetical protein